jgi:tetratricopeptide (TPR) repeat protein
MKNIYFILFSMVLANLAYGYGNTRSYLTPMPMPTQYNNLEQYQQALQIWENVNKTIVARNGSIQLPSMPLPTQYKNLDQYQHALQVWENVAHSQTGELKTDQITWIPALPKPTQYSNFEQYQQALQIWVQVQKQIVAQNPNIQPPSMPMPTQYENLEHYQAALQAWEELFQ